MTCHWNMTGVQVVALEGMKKWMAGARVVLAGYIEVYVEEPLGDTDQVVDAAELMPLERAGVVIATTPFMVLELVGEVVEITTSSSSSFPLPLSAKANANAQGSKTSQTLRSIAASNLAKQGQKAVSKG